MASDLETMLRLALNSLGDCRVLVERWRRAHEYARFPDELESALQPALPMVEIRVQQLAASAAERQALLDVANLARMYRAHEVREWPSTEAVRYAGELMRRLDDALAALPASAQPKPGA